MKKQLTLISAMMFVYGISPACTSDIDGNYTSLIINNSFETVNDFQVGSGSGGGDIKSPDGWTFTYSQAGWGDCKTVVNNDGTLPDGTACFNAWSGIVLGFNLSQNITGLPAGCYSLSALMHSGSAGDITDQHVYATVTTKNGAAYSYESSSLSETGVGSGWDKLATSLYVFSEQDVITVGAKSTGTSSTGTAGWFQVDNFQLLNTGDVDKGALDKLLTKAETLGTDKHPYNEQQLKEVIEFARTVDDSKETLLVAIDKLDEAIAEYDYLINAYVTLKTSITQLTNEISASEYPAKEFFETAVTEAQAIYDDTEYKREKIDAAIADLTEKNETLANLSLLKRAIANANKLLASSDYSGKETYAEAIVRISNIYNDPAKGNEIAAAINDLEAATKIYLAGRPSEWTTIKNGALWQDNRGKSVQAHGSGFLQVGDTWYMIGEDRDNTWDPDVNMYSSKDLVNWKFERKIISNDTHETMKNRFIERPKLLYCAKTGQYVVWCHYEQGNYGASEAAVFYCDSINGPYKYHWSGRPLGIKSRDCNVFVDDDGTAYFISTTNENRDLGLFRLSDDYLDAVEHTPLFQGQGREAPAIVRVGDTYFMLSSACSGWDPNRCKIAYSKSLTSGWSGLRDLGNPIAFDTQAASILTVQGSKGTSYLYVGDRWQDPNLPESKTIMFPIAFNGTTCTFKYRQQFDINFPTGEWRETDALSSRVSKNKWKVIGCSSQETSGENGAAANAIDGNVDTKWHTRYSGSVASAPHYIDVDMGEEYEVSGFLSTPRMDNGSANGLIREFIFYVSTDGKTWKAVAGGKWLPYCAEVYFEPVTARYFRLKALSGNYASIAELDMLQNIEFKPYTMSPRVKIGTGNWIKSDKLSGIDGVSLSLGADVMTGNTGWWSFAGANNHSALAQEYSISKLTSADEGLYTFMFLDAYNKVSRQDLTVTVKPNPLSVGTINTDKIAELKYFDLRGVEIKEPVNGEVYIMKTIYENGNMDIQKRVENNR